MDFAQSATDLAFRREVRRVARAALAPLLARMGEDLRPTPELMGALAAAGLNGLVIPPEYGGTAPAQGMAMRLCLAREELSRYAADIEPVVAVQGLGAYPIVLAGTAEQKQRFLPPICRGERLAAFALTEPGAGSDAASLECRAGRDGDHYVLNGHKIFISNACDIATYSLFARTGGEGYKGISAFIVEAGTPGCTVQPMEMVAAHIIGQVIFTNCRIPAAQLLGEEGKGFRVAMTTLDLFRASVGAQAVGLGLQALDLALARAKERRQFGRPIGEFQAIQLKLAEMASELKAAKLLVSHAAWCKDQGHRVTGESSMAKLFATEAAQRAVDAAVQIYGGYGVWKAYPTERLYRQVRAPRIYEGSSEVQKLVIARYLLEQGAADVARTMLDLAEE
jgi:alkylation response protein AidB-like acyl-CoA dehydrogenase